eukprot:gene12132-13385_t
MEEDDVKKYRTNVLNGLSKFIEDAQNKLDLFMKHLNWDREELSTQAAQDCKGLLQCPYDVNHRVKPDNLDKHVNICKFKVNGFKDVQDKDIPGSSKFFYNSLPSVNQIFLGKEDFDSLGIFCTPPDGAIPGLGAAQSLSTDSPSTAVESCLPANLMMTYATPEQRLKLYERVIEISKLKRKVPALTVEDIEKETEEQMNAILALENDEDRPRSHLEAMAELRDYKRRRQTYRAKNQSSKRRNPTDVLRELIDQQTKYLEILSGKKVIDSGAVETREESAGEDLRTRAEAEVRAKQRRSSRDERGYGMEERLCHEERRSEGRSRDERRYRDRSKERLRDEDKYRGTRYADGDQFSRNRSRERGWDKNRANDMKTSSEKVVEAHEYRDKDMQHREKYREVKESRVKADDEEQYENEVIEGLRNIRYSSSSAVSKSSDSKLDASILKCVQDDTRREEASNPNEASLHSGSSEDDDDVRARHKKSKHKHKHKKHKHKHKNKKRKFDEKNDDSLDY